MSGKRRFTNRIMHNVLRIGLFMLLMQSLAGCLDEVRYNMPCGKPEDIALEQIVGTWNVHYANYLSADSPSSPISGVETVMLHDDMSYNHEFQSNSFNYQYQGNWQLITTEIDGPKIKLYGFTYFANGIDYSTQKHQLRLQGFDQLTYQEVHNSTQLDADVKVEYPESGYVYLYPRVCLRKLVLLQMVSKGVDPDDMSVHNPSFSKP